MKARRFWTLFWFATACASSPPLDRSALPDARDYAGEPAVFLAHETTLRYALEDSGPVVVEDSRERLMILNERGSELGDVRVGFDGEFNRFVSAKVECWLPDGTRKVHFEKDFSTLPAGALMSAYSDLKIAYLDLPDMPAGTGIDIQTVIRNTDPELFAQRHSFHREVPVLQSKLRVEAPANWEVEFKPMLGWNPTALPPDRQERGEGLVLEWTKTDLLGHREEPLAPGFDDRSLKVAVRLARWQTAKGEIRTTNQSVEDFGRMLAELQAGTAEPTLEIRATTEKILAEVGEHPAARAAALYRWVQENIRYVAIEVGLGGWRPYRAAEVFDNRYGDCKDKATLLKAMLEVAGINSYMATLYSHSGMPRPYVFPNLGINSNHAILAVQLGDELIIADPTERTVPFGRLPPRDQEVELLVIDEKQPRIIETYGAPAEANFQHFLFDLVRKDGGGWEGTASIVMRGDDHDRLQYHLLSAKGSDEVGDSLGKRLPLEPHFYRSHPEWEHTTEDGEAVLRARLGVSFEVAETRAGDRVIFRLGEFLEPPVEDFDPGERSAPVVFRTRRTRSAELRLVLDGERVERLPEPVEVESPVGRYTLTWTEEDGHLVARRSFVLDQRIIPPESYDALVQFVETIFAAERAPVVLRRAST